MQINLIFMILDDVWSQNKEVKASIILNHMWEKSIANFRRFVTALSQSIRDPIRSEF